MAWIDHIPDDDVAACPTVLVLADANWPPGKNIVVRGSGSTNVWLAGVLPGSPRFHLAGHWNGTSYIYYSLEGLCAGDDSDVVDVFAPDSTHVWVLTSKKMLFWNGTSWSVVQTISGSTRFRALFGWSTTDVWIGLKPQGPGANQITMRHWDGTSWTAVILNSSDGPPFPMIGGPFEGAMYSATGGYSGHDSTDGRVFGLNLAANTFNTFYRDLAGGYIGIFYAADAVNVFGRWRDTGASAIDMTARHDGGGEHYENGGPLPYGHRYQYLEAGDGTGAGDAWVVGEYQDAVGYTPLALHWNGTAWTNLLPDNWLAGSPYDSALLFSCRALASNDVWAAGQARCRLDHSKDHEAFVIHWDGTVWTEVRPQPYP